MTPGFGLGHWDIGGQISQQQDWDKNGDRFNQGHVEYEEPVAPPGECSEGSQM